MWAAVAILILLGGRAGAIEPADSLRQGQYLVDRATAEIDRQLATFQGSADRELLYRGIRDLLGWEQVYAAERIEPRYPLKGPHGILVRDGVADTIATRLHGVLETYVQATPEELLTPGRRAFELGTAAIPMPPGRFLGFHYVQLAQLYAAQCDTIEAVVARTGQGDLEGMQDGYLRHLWDLNQLYQQAHATNADRYLCRVSQEDWMAERLFCPACGKRGMRLADQRMALREDTTAACRELIYSGRDDQATRVAAVLCRHWGHLFTARCKDRECAGTHEYSVPLPYYRLMQLELTRGDLTDPDLQELVRER